MHNSISALKSVPSFPQDSIVDGHLTLLLPEGAFNAGHLTVPLGKLEAYHKSFIFSPNFATLQITSQRPCFVSALA